VPLPFSPSLTIVIPTYNERENLPGVVRDALEFAERACTDFQILIVDDGSTDGTGDVLLKHPRVRVITHPHNRGLTAALRTGFFGATTDYVSWIPADGQIPLIELGKILDAWRGEDLVLSTYRHRPDGIRRAVMSKTVRLLVWAATGFRDRLEGPYLFRRSLIDELDLVSQKSAGSIGLEIGAKTRARGLRVGSTEIECAPRLSGRSKVANLKNIAQYLAEVWRIGRSMKRL
jgi:glycosyltransferase involved in cell wall biosynthesis